MQFADEAQVLPGKIDKDVDFKPERPDEVFGLAEKTPRESLRIPTRIHSNRNDSALLFKFMLFRLAAVSAPTLLFWLQNRNDSAPLFYLRFSGLPRFQPRVLF